jgi:hypothetical protein
MTKAQVQAVLGPPEEELVRSQFSDYVEWLYHARGVFVGFDRRGLCGEITMLKKSAPRLGGVSLLHVGAREAWTLLRQLDAQSAEDDNHSLISMVLCISIYAPHIDEDPSEPATNVMVFRPDYMDAR